MTLHREKLDKKDGRACRPGNANDHPEGKTGIINKILCLEQEGEHAVINRIERNLTMTLNKSTRYWQVLREYENKLYNGLK